MIWSRILAVLIFVAVAAWIGFGQFGGAQKEAPTASAEAQRPEPPPFRVGVATVSTAPHAPRLVLSGRTEADKRATAMVRAPGIVVDLKVRRGSVVKTGDVVAVLSDEARESQVMQARAKVEHRRSEANAKLRLIETGVIANLQKPLVEAELRAAEAALAQAEAEREKGKVLAPIAGVVNEVPIEVGQALQTGVSAAEIIALDPMLAVVEIAERQLGGVAVGDAAEVRLITGQKVKGEVRFISQRASQQTRTYRVEVGLANPSGTIPDGVTCEVALSLAKVMASEVPRSALTFSSEGKLGVRIVRDDNIVAFLPVGLVQDGAERLHVSGIPDGSRLIVQGQDFVRDGVKVEPVMTAALARAD